MARKQAATEFKSAPIAGEFGRSRAIWLFGEDTVASLPLYVRGPKKGQPKGFICWNKTTEAGYHVNMGGGVAAGVTVRAWIALTESMDEKAATTGIWMGRSQTLCGSHSTLGPERRALAAAEVARDRAEFEAEAAKLLGTSKS
jgi:hypothetical protein